LRPNRTTLLLDRPAIDSTNRRGDTRGSRQVRGLGGAHQGV